MELHPLLTKLWLMTVNSLKFKQSKGNKSSIVHDTMMKLHLHNYKLVINYSV